MYIVFNKELLAKKVSGYRILVLKITVIITLILGFIGTKTYIEAYAILSDHTAVQASVTHTEHRQEKGKLGLMKDVYLVSYVFSVGVKNYQSSFNTNAEKFSRYKKNGVVTIAYSNRDPNDFERLDLLKRQADPLDLARRVGLVFVLVYLFFSIFVWVAKARLKKKLGQPMEVQ